MKATILKEKVRMNGFEKQNFDVLKILADQYSVKILEATKEVPKSCIEISYETNVPISTVYRRVQQLCDMSFLKVTGSISEDGKKFFMYQCKIDSIVTKFDGVIKIEITFS